MAIFAGYLTQLGTKAGRSVYISNGPYAYTGTKTIQEVTTNKTVTQGQERKGTRLELREDIKTISQGDTTISSEFIQYMRSRNIEFAAKRFRPFTQIYAFFDGQNVNEFVVPKLLEIQMQSGVFQVGETVVGTLPLSPIEDNFTPETTLDKIIFRVASANHKYGPYNNATDVYVRNPYDQQNTSTLPSEYSSTTTLLNIDTVSLSEQTLGSFYGYVTLGLKLKGQTSGAEAIITNVRLVTDNVGTLIGSFYIPNPNIPSNPVFETGSKTFRLTSNATNAQIEDVTDTSGSQQFYSQGTLNTVQERILSVRTPKLETVTLTENRTISNTSSSTRAYVPGQQLINTSTICYKDPLAQSFSVDEEQGVFATKVDLFFRTKDEVLPVIVQLRSMALGTPTTEVYPFSEVVVDPKDVNVSEDGTVATTITFPSPVYLKNGEHAIVLLSDSNSYNVWISRLGEVDVSTASGPESQQVIVTQQVLLGSLFKSQNGSTWDPSQYEDLKITLYKAQFDTSTTGDINFYNPELSVGNKQIANLLVNPLEFNSRTLRIGLAKTVTDTGLTLGNTIIQTNSNASGNYVGAAGSAIGTMTIVNSGIGYSDGSFANVALTNVTGSGRDATADITVINNVATAATISNNGSGYRVGDVLTATNFSGSTLGRNLRLSIASIDAINELIVDNVQGTFTTGAGSTIAYIATGIGSTNLNGTAGNVEVNYATVDSEEKEGTYIKVNHKNHGMYALNNDVIISGVYSDSLPSFLTTEVVKDSTASITLSDMILDPITGIGIFETFENVSVSSTNPGYVLIDREIIAYEGVSGNTLTGITRQIDQTKSFSYTVGTPVFKYEIDGVSLRRINKTHTIQDSSSLDRPLDLDYYYIKVDTSQAGKTESLPYGQVDRSVSTSFPRLYINETKSTGGPNIYATQNIPFEIMRANIQTLRLANTNISAEVRTISGSSIDGSEESYLDQGFEPINLDANTYFSTPRIVASKTNESSKLLSAVFDGKKSLTLNMKLNSSNEDISPMIDLDRVSLVLTSNRVNSPITNYATDFRVSSLRDDPSAFVYTTNAIALEIPATSLKVIVSAYINQLSDLRALYAIMKDPNEDPVYYPFPGYSNLTNIGEVIDPANNDGSPDAVILKSDNFASLSPQLNYVDQTFTINNLPLFKYFSIKLIGSSQDQAHPPRLREFRSIALA